MKSNALYSNAIRRLYSATSNPHFSRSAIEGSTGRLGWKSPVDWQLDKTPSPSRLTIKGRNCSIMPFVSPNCLFSPTLHCIGRPYQWPLRERMLSKKVSSWATVFGRFKSFTPTSFTGDLVIWSALLRWSNGFVSLAVEKGVEQAE